MFNCFSIGRFVIKSERADINLRIILAIIYNSKITAISINFTVNESATSSIVLFAPTIILLVKFSLIILDFSVFSSCFSSTFSTIAFFIFSSIFVFFITIALTGLNKIKEAIEDDN